MTTDRYMVIYDEKHGYYKCVPSFKIKYNEILRNFSYAVNDNGYPYVLYKEINKFYEQEIFDTDSKYFDETGQVLDSVEYAKNHIQLLRDDYQ